MLKLNDLIQLKDRGMTLESFIEQIQYFINGIEPLDICRIAAVGDGILRLTPEQVDYYLNLYQEACNRYNIVKFVPASGAATRMFKDLFVFAENFPLSNDSYAEFIEKNKLQSVDHLFGNLEKFAFYGQLKRKFEEKGESLEEKTASRRYQEIADMILYPEGLNYGALPKGLLAFHLYREGRARTPVEEHLMEGILYSCGQGGEVNVHFTVSPEHEMRFKELVSRVSPDLEQRFGVKINVSFSNQKHFTDTIAVTPDNTPLRDEQDRIVFRPGGHGALIENLNELTEDIVFIKNIDNVVPDSQKEVTVRYKKALAGKLIHLQNKIFSYLRSMDSLEGIGSLKEIEDFARGELMLDFPPDYDSFSASEKIGFLHIKLNRPIRVCGMVKNQGEPGGGPFWVRDEDGTCSLQIVESAQIDMEDPEKLFIFKESTHFNPVDLVCGIRNYKGEKFDLLQYVDPDAGFISSKSINGRPLKALELPGLWNGAMSDWTTVFVEVPIETFNPVKTVNDLLGRQPDYSE